MPPQKAAKVFFAAFETEPPQSQPRGRHDKIPFLPPDPVCRLATAFAFGFCAPANAGGHMIVDSIHFLIPGGAGGGWDGTARGTGEALTRSGLVGSASYENMSGGGGGKAIGFLIENADSQHGTLMVNSTPIVIRSLTGVFPHNFRDLTLVAGTIGDYAALVVGKDSPIDSMGACWRLTGTIPRAWPSAADPCRGAWTTWWRRW